MNELVKQALRGINAPELHLYGLGMEKLTPEEVEALFFVVNERFEHDMKTTFSSNLRAWEIADNLDEWGKSAGSDIYGRAIVRRMVEMKLRRGEVQTQKERENPKPETRPVNENKTDNQSPEDWPYKKYTKRGTMPKPVAQYELKTGEKLGEFPSMAAAQKATGIDDHSISKCCQNRCIHAGGYRWKYI